MYDNIGAKIKSLAKGLFVIETIGAVIAGTSLISTIDDYILLGLLVLFGGSFFAWVSSLFLYAFGELVEDVHVIRHMRYLQAGESSKRENTSSPDNTTTSNVPYLCGKCGHKGPYEGNCPKCNSSLKKYNV